MINKQKFNTLKKYVLKNGGATIQLGYSSYDSNCQALYFITEKNGYAVSIKGAEKIVNDLTIETINNYINSNYEILTNGHGYFLGIWIHNGKIYLDITMIFSSIYNAIDSANMNNQIEYYDFKLGKSVKLNG
jgi:hypothetical protein